MIRKIDLENQTLIQELFSLQRLAYLIEAKLINFYDIPPLKESIEELIECGETFLGYFEDDELAGAVSFTKKREELTICRMVVHPNHFRKGIAHKLLTAVEEMEPAVPIIRVSTGKDNFPAKKLYQKNDYQLETEIEVAPGLYISSLKKERLY
ncbi:GNAT family N-acetyltransferase [Bacillus sp. MRMR6]|uniref:GNAT family N-acetyltransferase n=1 Tax=Bacillus sp. MRMR6 TaxID=1928617 RepID=UPI000952B412|nr:GNAT family N-acetyltransferase [Bacillus sp. MRMR6]OLS36854.1 GNAT family N-acetyltransferase [Bacillus sp. MRMR6]